MSGRESDQLESYKTTLHGREEEELYNVLVLLHCSTIFQLDQCCSNTF